ncbi:hypothetical protein OS493_021530 [Desmophyllum pertusum]|uniref:F5/8 type C domain-containing protein n=1 Tax=Desmophyllum pertusum TaxID=174260 RepID=A0A9X0CLC4_9CNID|nr:hypothetical protein OS493_021530 [Desmophyllum pertusum]
MRVKSFLLWGFLVISWFRGVYGACSTALGMENRNIKDEQISASSQNSYKAKPSYARLNNKSDKLSFGGWCAKDTDKNSFLQIDLLFPHTLTRIATQGAASNYVGQYSLTFSYDNISWFNYTVGGKIKFFRGNINQFRTVYNNLTEPLTTRLVRFHPVFVQGTASCARLELYGCQPSEDCNTAVGVEDRKITDQQITASSHWNQHHASNARLNNKLRSWSNSSGVGIIWGGWCTDKLDKNQYLQVDLSRVRSIPV